ncbi:hypothetical protein SUGI_1123700 [Cryptomeria japonica]|nr:hypothetical protein SUGI_1123700 [Cryptomeria japonica]
MYIWWSGIGVAEHCRDICRYQCERMHDPRCFWQRFAGFDAKMAGNAWDLGPLVGACTCNTAGVMVVLEASHICMLSRGVEKIGSRMATIAVLGRFVIDSAAIVAFFQKILSRDPKRR